MRTPLLNKIFAQLENELGNAKRKHPDFPTVHHGVSVVREEYLELEKECFTDGIDYKKSIRDAAKTEAVHVAVTCIRLIEFLS